MARKNTEQKQFWEWIKLKENLHRQGMLPNIHEGEIWWAAMGENIGIEINGKHASFSRPVLIFKELSRYGFLAIPLTSQEHEGSWYTKFEFRGKQEYAALAQIRLNNIFRLLIMVIYAIKYVLIAKRVAYQI